MQEDIEHRAVTLAINAGKMTGRTFRNALAKLLHFLKSKHKQHKQVKPCGKQSVKKLIGQNQGVSRVDLSHDDDVKQFEHVARKYGSGQRCADSGAGGIYCAADARQGKAVAAQQAAPAVAGWTGACSTAKGG